MYRTLLVSVIAVGLLAGCAQLQPKMEMKEMKKPAVPAEMAKLQGWIGSWSGTAEMVSPTPEEMKKMMPEGSKEMPKTMPGGEKVEWTLGGMVLKSEGWYDMGDGKRRSYVSYTVWDPKAKKYHGWSVSDWGDISEGWMTADPGGKTFRMTEKGTDADGQPDTAEGTMTLVDDKTMEWTVSVNGPQGKMKLKGTSKKQP
ncbi:MAG TPA: hypothetical protein VMV94_02550 [Phycisphaerae bacterium]|nr:hypothetical protein [Phycisphaerae bacterium]